MSPRLAVHGAIISGSGHEPSRIGSSSRGPRSEPVADDLPLGLQELDAEGVAGAGQADGHFGPDRAGMGREDDDVVGQIDGLRRAAGGLYAYELRL